MNAGISAAVCAAVRSHIERLNEKKKEVERNKTIPHEWWKKYMEDDGESPAPTA